jgi:hypothetical protein
VCNRGVNTLLGVGMTALELLEDLSCLFKVCFLPKVEGFISIICCFVDSLGP